MKKVSREKKNGEKDLIFYLRYYQEFAGRSERMKQVVDREIELLVEKLKEIK